MNNWMDIKSISELNVDEYLQQIVRLYREVFSESNWKEWLKCTDENCWYQCNYSKAPGSWKCQNCGSELTNFYSEDEIRWFVESLFTKNYYQAFIGVNDSQKVVAFTWGWVDSLVSLNDEKLWLSDEEFRELQKNLTWIWLNPEEDFYYQSETWVDPWEQWKGLWKNITRKNQEILEGNEKQIWQILQRTSRQSRMYNIRVEQGYRLVYEYGDPEERVLFAKQNKAWS